MQILTTCARVLGGNGGENYGRKIFHSRGAPTDATGAMASAEGHLNFTHDARVAKEHSEELEASILINRFVGLASFLHLQAAL